MSSFEAAIVVGVDGSEQSLRAVDWAAAEAAATGSALTICHVTPLGPHVDPRLRPVYEDVLAHGHRVTADAVERVEAAWPEVTVKPVLASGSAAGTLVSTAAPARLLVVGGRGVGAFRGLLLGSVSAQVAAHATGPVVVVHGGPGGVPAGAPIVVGVDDSGSEPALAFAFEFAARQQHPLLVVHASRLPGADMWVDPALGSPSRSYHRAAQELLDAQVRPWTEKYPEVPAETLVLNARPAPALIERSAYAALVVVGSHGHGGFTGLLLGSVSQHVLRHAGCPVAVVRH